MKQPYNPLWCTKEISETVSPIEYDAQSGRPAIKAKLEIQFDPIQKIVAVFLRAEYGGGEVMHVFSCNPQEFQRISLEIGRIADAAVEAVDHLDIFQVTVCGQGKKKGLKPTQ